MLPDFDKDYIPLALIVMMVVVWVTALSQGESAVTLAADILAFGIGAVAGYMSKGEKD